MENRKVVVVIYILDMRILFDTVSYQIVLSSTRSTVWSKPL